MGVRRYATFRNYDNVEFSSMCEIFNGIISKVNEVWKTDPVNFYYMRMGY